MIKKLMGINEIKKANKIIKKNKVIQICFLNI